MSSDPKRDKFVKGILNTVMRSAIARTMWGLPVPIVIAIAVVADVLIWRFELF